MELSQYLIYLTISIAASVSVGPSVILAASNGINFGRRKALSGVLGHVFAIFLLAIISATGVGALLLASPATFQIIKFIGIGYLVYVGVQIIRSKGSWAFQVNANNAPSKTSLFKKSFFIAISNPKAIIFFSSLFPQFLQPDHPLLPQFMILAGTSLLNAFGFTFAYVLVAYKFKERLLAGINKGWLPKLTGTAFLFFASALAINK
ncbi:LysE family translocator [Thalassotalea eurytherma]|uniref:Flagellar biosynthesis protein FlgM n=1 Tax=Thalassotalea eurytherma TaxID=1144278 RepID=A0ABQ6H0U0_9GAMM|nr:LysE family translocator [Thalassotalea eurytherma]GLX81114.1 flagellar biosynthesis protein FlgM [Thalassotalea eurytherma]